MTDSVTAQHSAASHPEARRAARSTVTPDDPPGRPRLRRGLTVLELPESIVIEGGPARVRLSGPHAKPVLAPLLAMLGDQRPATDEPPRELATDSRLAQEALALLAKIGILEEREERDGAVRLSSATLSYLSCRLADTRSCASAEQAARRLQERSVLIVGGEGPVSGQLSRLLRACGVGCRRLVRPEEFAEAGLAVVVMDGGGTYGAAGSDLAAAVRAQIPLLVVRLHHDRLEVGPYLAEGVERGEGVRAAAVGPGTIDAASPGGRVTLCLAAAEIARVIAGVNCELLDGECVVELDIGRGARRVRRAEPGASGSRGEQPRARRGRYEQ